MTGSEKHKIMIKKMMRSWVIAQGWLFRSFYEKRAGMKLMPALVAPLIVREDNGGTSKSLYRLFRRS
jgi:hypothetical protein